MRLLLTTNGRLYRAGKGAYYTPLVYGYSFFKRYLGVYDEIRLVAHVESIAGKEARPMLRVDGEGLTVHEVLFPHGKLDYIRKYIRISRQLKSAADGCDVAIFRIPDQLAFQAMKVAKGAKLPIGVEVTSNPYEFFSKGSMKGPLRPLLRLLWDRQQKWACKAADASCYVTRHALQKRYPPNPGDSAFSTYCSDVDLSSFSARPRDYGSDPLTALRCIHVSGSLGGSAKGHFELLQAAALLKRRGIEVRCILVGGGALSRANQKIIEKNALDVVLTGTVDSEHIARAMRTADVFVLPSYREGLPRAVIEAMSAGLVCVATNLEGIKELLDERMMVPARDAHALADRLEKLAKNPELMTAQSRQNILRAKLYAPESLQQKREAFYGYLCRKAKGRAPLK